MIGFSVFVLPSVYGWPVVNRHLLKEGLVMVCHQKTDGDIRSDCCEYRCNAVLFVVSIVSLSGSLDSCHNLVGVGLLEAAATGADRLDIE